MPSGPASASAAFCSLAAGICVGSAVTWYWATVIASTCPLAPVMLPRIAGSGMVLSRSCNASLR